MRCAFREPTLDSWTLQHPASAQCALPSRGRGAPMSALETWTLPGPSIPAADCREGLRPLPPAVEAAANVGSG
eukprot:7507319-Pyramimonas_sp.AAC.1